MHCGIHWVDYIVTTDVYSRFKHTTNKNSTSPVQCLTCLTWVSPTPVKSKKSPEKVPWMSESRRMWNLSPRFGRKLQYLKWTQAVNENVKSSERGSTSSVCRPTWQKTTTTTKIALGCKPDEDWTSVIPVLTHWDDTGWQLTKVTIKKTLNYRHRLAL